MTDDAELLAAWCGGDRAALGTLVDRHSTRVYAICLRYFRDPLEAEEAVQETFVTVARRGHTFRGGAAFSTWLHRVTMNTCHDLARRRTRRLPPADPHDHVAEEADPDDPIARRELATDLRAALDGLDDDSRDLVVLHDLRGVPYAEIAERLGLAVGTVKSRIHRAHVRLAESLREPDAPPRRPSGQS